MANNTISQVEINGATYDLLDAATRSTVSQLDQRVSTLEDSVSRGDQKTQSGLIFNDFFIAMQFINNTENKRYRLQLSKNGAVDLFNNNDNNTEWTWEYSLNVTDWFTTSNNIHYRRMHNIIYLTGLEIPTSSNGQVLAHLPDGFVPKYYTIVTAFGAPDARISIGTNGDITSWWNTSGTSGSRNISFSSAYPVNR